MFNKSRGLHAASLIAVFSLVLTACGDSQKTVQNEIKIESEVITTSATPAKKAVVTEFLESKKSLVAKLSKEFSSNFPGNFTIDEDEKHAIGGLVIPTLQYNGHSLHLDHSAPDKFTTQYPAVATIFVKSGEDFIRIATSLKKEDGERAFGTTLDRKHPAYATTLAGNPYSGTATLFGMIYVTEYNPIRDAAGNIVGMLFVGENITADLLPLKAQLR